MTPAVKEFIEISEKWERTYRAGQDAWIVELRAQGVVAAHPDDGWVDRSGNTIHLAYPYFRGKIAVGDLIALGDHEKWRIVRVTAINAWLGLETISFQEPTP